MIKFNEQQLKAINHKNGACAVIAGAGSGKSTVLIERVRNLIDDDVNEKDILVITFTRNTSDELKYKLHKLGINDVSIGTFHSIGARILTNEGVNCGKQLLDFQIKNEFERQNGGNKVNMKDILSFISYQKNYGKNYTDEYVSKNSDYSEEELRNYHKIYEELKTKMKAIDFDDMLIKSLEVMKAKPSKYTFKYILVDEHQDSNLIQNEMIKYLCPSKNVFCVFDYRQAIYTFRGGNPEYCMNFKEEYPDATIINLDTNYRSCSNIVSNANNFIKQYYGTYEFYSDSIANIKSNGDINLLTSYEKSDEAKAIVDDIELKIKNGCDLKDFSILYRLNSHSIYIENELKSRDIEYYVDNNGSFFKRREIELIMSILRLILNPHDNEAFEFVFKTGTKPIGFVKYSVLSDLLEFGAINNLSLYESSLLMKYKMSYIKNNMIKFDTYIHRLSDQYKKTGDLKQLINNIIISFDIENWIYNKYDSEDEIDERTESLNSLKEFIRNNTLESFISYVYGKNNHKKNNNKNCIQLMSIHKSKGLEFKNVYIIGVEDNKFPHKNSRTDEEARLFYVGITRAKENLIISQLGKCNRFISEYFQK